MPENDGPSKQSRNRTKGFAWLLESLINPDRPLGLGWPDRPWRDIPVILQRGKKGGPQPVDQVARFDWALELNARAVGFYDAAARYEPLGPEIEDALATMPGLSDERYPEAVAHLTVHASVTEHEEAFADTVAKAVRRRRHVAALAQLLRIRRVLDKGRRDAALMHENRARFVRDSVGNNRRPTEATLLRTFLPFALVDGVRASVRQIKDAFLHRRALRRSSDVVAADLASMAFHAGVNPSTIYLDYDYLDDLLDLAAYAGARARGARVQLTAAQAAVYGEMLCEGGEDPEPDPHLRRERAHLAAALRAVWLQVPGLVDATRSHGVLAAT